MNYEEMLAARNEGRQHKTAFPIGDYYREEVDGKWRAVVDIRPEQHQNIAFSKALALECEKNKALANKRLLHFTPVEEAGEIKRLELELGSYQTFEQLLIDNPAVIAGKGFADDVLEALVDVTSYLHQQGIMHICYSPRTVLVRKGAADSVLLLSHGSFYLNIHDQREFYGEEASFVAPEVLDHGTIDERCDVYGIGKFMQSLFSQADLPLEYRQAVKKATSEAPEDRFATPEDMLHSVQRRRSMYSSLLSLLIAALVAALCLFVYFEIFPESENVEFVKPAPRQAMDDLLDDGLSLEELGLGTGDSLALDSMPTQRDYEAKAEEIFRRKYEKEAERVLSKIYNKEYMSNSEKKFMTESESTINELMKIQGEMSAESGLSQERAQLIATQIIERITEQKKKELGGTNSRGVKLPQRN